jgi:hypothetical protein
MASGTLDANDETVGPVDVPAGKTGFFGVTITGTITVTLYRDVGSGAIAVEDGYTSSTTKNIEGPGQYSLVASGVSGGSATCLITWV